jgi:hypothetical protein
MWAALVRWVFASAGIARIAVIANAVIRVFMTILLEKYRQAYLATDHCTKENNFVRIKNAASDCSAGELQFSNTRNRGSSK